MIKFQHGLIKTLQLLRIVLEKITQAAMARDVARKARDSVEEKELLNFQAYQVN